MLNQSVHLITYVPSINHRQIWEVLLFPTLIPCWNRIIKHILLTWYLLHWINYGLLSLQLHLAHLTRLNSWRVRLTLLPLKQCLIDQFLFIKLSRLSITLLHLILHRGILLLLSLLVIRLWQILIVLGDIKHHNVMLIITQCTTGVNSTL